MTRKVGIYSGTFDPVHNGHIAFATEAMKQCDLEKVFFLVEPSPRRKQGVKALEHRQNMVRLAIQTVPGLGQIKLEDRRFTVSQTLPVLLARFKDAELHFLMGDDMLAHFTDADWPHINEFIKAVSLIIGVRHRQIQDVRRHVELLESTRGVRIRYQTFQPSQAVRNATSVRAQLRQGKQPTGINPKVMEYIREKGLYAGDPSASK